MPNVRQTSIDCYNKIKAEGLLSRRRLQIYKIFVDNGPLTGTEVSVIFKQKHFATSHSEGVRNRITELFIMDAVYEKGTKKCTLSGNMVTVWDLTDRLPDIEKLKNKLSKRGKVKVLRGMVVELEARSIDLFMKMELNAIKDYIDTI